MDEQLIQRIRNCPNLPSMPAIAMQVLDLASKPDVDIAEIARIITKDPALSGKILRTVNSSFYSRSQTVGTISHALVILGLQAVKTLVLGFSLVTNLAKNKSNGGAAGGFKHVTYWRHSIYSATAARSLAARVKVVQQEEAFLAGLLMDIGMLVLDQVLGEAYGKVHATVASHAALAEAERAALGTDHAAAGAVLAAQWKFPPLLAAPIASHHEPEAVEDPTLRKLTELVRVGGCCADVFVDEQPAAAIAVVRQMCQAQYGMAEADCDALLDEIGKRTKEVASLFEIQIGAGSDFETIQRKANEVLIELTLQTQQHAHALTKQATSLVEQNQALKKQATTDSLTGLANRARFDQFLADQFALAARTGKPLALLLMDVDKFKTVNDRFGHPVGDKVLKHLGAVLATAARPGDLAARYGGEELCMVLPDTNRATATATAERIRRAIALRPLPVIAAPGLPVTASVGVACLEPPNSPFRAPAHLLKAADLAVYNAKRSGRNCVRVFSLPPAKPGAAKPAA